MNATTTARARLRAELALGTVLLRGWHLDGPGPARYGWATRSPAGRVHYRGRTLAEVLASASTDNWEVAP